MKKITIYLCVLATFCATTIKPADVSIDPVEQPTGDPYQRQPMEPREDQPAETSQGVARPTQLKPYQKLFEAVASGDIDGIKALLKTAKTNPNGPRDENGNTLLHYAKGLPMIMYLVENVAEKDRKAFVNAQNNDGIARLHIDTVFGHLPEVKYLLSKGARVDIATKNKVTPLHLAMMISYFENPKLATGLLTTVIVGSGIIGGVTGGIAAYGAATALAASLGLTAAAYSEGAVLVTADIVAGKTLATGVTTIAQTAPTVATEAATEAAAATPGGITPTTLTTGVGTTTQTASTAQAGISGSTATGSAASAATAVAIIAAAIITTDIAIRNEIVNVLVVKGGADVNAKTSNGDTPLHVVASGPLLKPTNRHGGRLMAELLIARGANRRLTNNDGQTPYDIAVENDRADLLPVLGIEGKTVRLDQAKIAVEKVSTGAQKTVTTLKKDKGVQEAKKGIQSLRNR